MNLQMHGTTPNLLPQIDCYCEGTTKANAMVIEWGILRVWYSYKTPVAIQINSGPIHVSKNSWGVTTGKHLNAIDGGDKDAKARRLPHEDILDMAQMAVCNRRDPNLFWSHMQDDFNRCIDERNHRLC